MLDKLNKWTLDYVDRQIQKARARGDQKTVLKLTEIRAWFLQKLEELGRHVK